MTMDAIFPHVPPARASDRLPRSQENIDPEGSFESVAADALGDEAAARVPVEDAAAETALKQRATPGVPRSRLQGHGALQQGSAQPPMPPSRATLQPTSPRASLRGTAVDAHASLPELAPALITDDTPFLARADSNITMPSLSGVLMGAAETRPAAAAAHAPLLAHPHERARHSDRAHKNHAAERAPPPSAPHEPARAAPLHVKHAPDAIADDDARHEPARSAPLHVKHAPDAIADDAALSEARGAHDVRTIRLRRPTESSPAETDAPIIERALDLPPMGTEAAAPALAISPALGAQLAVALGTRPFVSSPETLEPSSLARRSLDAPPRSRETTPRGVAHAPHRLDGSDAQSTLAGARFTQPSSNPTAAAPSSAPLFGPQSRTRSSHAQPGGAALSSSARPHRTAGNDEPPLWALAPLVTPPAPPEIVQSTTARTSSMRVLDGGALTRSAAAVAHEHRGERVEDLAPSTSDAGAFSASASARTPSAGFFEAAEAAAARPRNDAKLSPTREPMAVDAHRDVSGATTTPAPLPRSPAGNDAHATSASAGARQAQATLADAPAARAHKAIAVDAVIAEAATELPRAVADQREATQAREAVAEPPAPIAPGQVATSQALPEAPRDIAPIAAPRLVSSTSSADDPVAAAIVSPGLARLTLEMPGEAPVQLEVRTHEGVADVRVIGLLSQPSERLESGLRTALASEGIALGTFDARGNHESSGGGNRRSDAPHLPEGKRVAHVATSTPSHTLSGGRHSVRA
jgi:hypothetical protein